MTILPKGSGPISRAIRELDQRTKAMVPGQVVGANVSVTTRGFLIEPTAKSNTPVQPIPQRPRWG